MDKICKHCFYWENGSLPFCENPESPFCGKQISCEHTCDKWYFVPELGNLLFGNSRGIFPVERGVFIDAWNEFCEKWDIDYHGHPSGKSEFLYDRFYDKDTCAYVTPVFTIRPYYWGEDDAIAILPNFVCDYVEIQWYKYFDRDSYCNIELTVERFKELLDKCDKWLEENKTLV